jgi:hypothetical protein
MPETPRDTRRDADGWETIAHHDFGGVAELDATIAAALDDSGPDQPLYRTVNTEPAERFLSSATDADAMVVFRIGGQTIRVSADGRVQLRQPCADDAS